MSSVSKLALSAATDQVGPVAAVIYCRVSSVAQLQKGHGNGSQETRCREFARHKAMMSSRSLPMKRSQAA